MPLELPIKTEESLFMSFEHSPNDWTETESRYNKHDWLKVWLLVNPPWSSKSIIDYWIYQYKYLKFSL